MQDKDETMTSQIERMTSQIVSSYVCYDGSSKQDGGWHASILQRHLGSDIINLTETFIFVGRIVHICGRNVHEIRDVSAKNCGRNGSWPKRPVTTHLISSTTNLAACVSVQNLTNFCPHALISTPNVPKFFFA